MIDAAVIADSICTTRITTMELTMPKWLVAQLNTHRCFSRNSASSRAIPLAKLRQQVLENPYIPSEWPRNQKGMQGGEPLGEEAARQARRRWLSALRDAACEHEELELLGVHKEVANRLLEPFMWTKVIVTSTEWHNFFKLRLPGAGAQHEIGRLAMAMKAAMDSSLPTRLHPGEWHLPYITGDEVGDKLMISAARCARVSYLNHGENSPTEKDVALADRLIVSGHWSPFEHQACAMHNRGRSRNFQGWRQYREALD